MLSVTRRNNGGIRGALSSAPSAEAHCRMRTPVRSKALNVPSGTAQPGSVAPRQYARSQMVYPGVFDFTRTEDPVATPCRCRCARHSRRGRLRASALVHGPAARRPADRAPPPGAAAWRPAPPPPSCSPAPVRMERSRAPVSELSRRFTMGQRSWPGAARSCFPAPVCPFAAPYTADVYIQGAPCPSGTSARTLMVGTLLVSQQSNKNPAGCGL